MDRTRRELLFLPSLASQLSKRSSEGLGKVGHISEISPISEIRDPISEVFRKVGGFQDREVWVSWGRFTRSWSVGGQSRGGVRVRNWHRAVPPPLRASPGCSRHTRYVLEPSGTPLQFPIAPNRSEQKKGDISRYPDHQKNTSLYSHDFFLKEHIQDLIHFL